MSPTAGRPAGFFARAAGVLRPGHEHTAYTATLLLMVAQITSRLVGWLREMYIASAFGASAQTDAFVAAFQIPDFLYYIVAGGAASTTFISIYARYLAEKREAEAQRVFNVVVTVMVLVLTGLIVLGEIFTEALVRKVFPGFRAHPEQVQLCAALTRIILPMQLFFYVGALPSAVLQARRLFLLPAITPILYTAGIILGGVTLSSRLGIASLAVGALAGAFAGPFLINTLGAARAGIGYRPSFAIREPGFREWVKLSIPLMLGVSLATADEWIMRSFASQAVGEISRLNYAKRLFAVPYGVLGLAVGAASMTFFARLFSEKRLREFADTINGAVFRSAATSFLLSAWLVAAALPAMDLALRRGRFTFADSQTAATYFAVFSISLALWTAQALYARAFYATRDTLTPMVAATAITLASIPLFLLLFRAWGVMGLAIASDVGILAQAVVLAWLLGRRGLVPLDAMPWAELMKALATAMFAAVLGLLVARAVPLTGSRVADFESLVLVTATWGAAVALGLWVTRSELPQALRGRGAAAPNGAGLERELPEP